MLSDDEIHESIRQERRRSLAVGWAFADACRRGDQTAFWELINLINEDPCDGWVHAMRWAGRLEVRVAPIISEAFLEAWIENKSIARSFETSLALIPALRNLLPVYTGPALRLYRGASWKERRRRTYGLSWSTHLHVAEKFASDSRQCSEGGSCILETDAASDAIIGSTELVEDYYNEGEYLVDRRRLSVVRVFQRVPQINREVFLRRMREEMTCREKTMGAGGGRLRMGAR